MLLFHYYAAAFRYDTWFAYLRRRHCYRRRYCFLMLPATPFFATRHDYAAAADTP